MAPADAFEIEDELLLAERVLLSLPPPLSGDYCNETAVFASTRSICHSVENGTGDEDDVLRESWLSVTLLTVDASFPAAVRRLPIVRQRTIQVAPILYAIATVRAKSTEVRLISEAVEQNRLVLHVLGNVLHGTIAAAVSGGIVRLRRTFLTGDSVPGSPVLRHVLDAQVCVLRRGRSLPLWLFAYYRACAPADPGGWVAR